MPDPFPVTFTDAEWRSRLSPEQYRVMRRHGTEAPGTCAVAGQLLLETPPIAFGTFSVPAESPLTGV